MERHKQQIFGIHRARTTDNHSSSLHLQVAAIQLEKLNTSSIAEKYRAIGIQYPRGEHTLPNGRKEWFSQIELLENEHTETAVIIIAHPDDEAFVGGTIAKIAKRGKRVAVISLTNGAATAKNQTFDDMVRICREEEQNALSMLGAHVYINLGFPDGKLRFNEQEAARHTNAISPNF